MSEATRSTYAAVCYRSGGWWAVDVPEVAGVHTQARRLDQVEDMSRDAISLMLKVPADSFDIEVHPRLTEGAIETIERLEKATDVAVTAQANLTDARIAAARELVEGMGLTVRDAGRILGISFQRIDQLIHS